MQFKKNFLRIFFVILLASFYSAFAAKMTASPILTKINGLTISSAPGQITLTNSSGSDIQVATMVLSFSLDQASLTSLWGTPWLNWKPYSSNSEKKLAPLNYQFINEANLANNVLANGASITVQYSPQPWNNKAAPENVQLFNLSYVLSPAAITSSVVQKSGVNTITITNSSNSAISLNGAQLKLNYQGQIGSIWGTPWANWSVTNSAPDYILNSGVAIQIPANETLTLSFSGDSKPITNISLWVQSSSDTTKQGSVQVNLPSAPSAGVTTNPKITLTGPSYPKGQQYSGIWGQPLVINNLLVGSYVLTTPDVQNSEKTYKASFLPNPVIVSDATSAKVALSYTEAKALAKLNISFPNAPASNMANPSISIQGPDFPNATTFTSTWGSSLQICANGASSCTGITAGNYTLTLPKVYSSTDAYTVSGINNPIVLEENQNLIIPIDYVPVLQGSFTVNISASTSEKQNYAVTFTNAAGYVFTKNLVAGDNAVSLPISDTYVVTAPSLNGQSATVTPSSISVSETGTPNVAIKYSVGASSKFVVYFGGWQGGLFDLNTKLPTNVTAVNLSFANITPNLQIDTGPSGWMTNVPAPNVTMQPSYINWTVYKYNHPETKILLSVGGATYSAIWTSVLTAANADTIAQNIAKVINASYPVYKGTISYPANLLGSVSIDGVDLDIEAGGRLSAAISDNVALLTNSLKKYLNPGKLITFAGFSVGADPNNSQCTVPESIHCGEDIPLLQSIGNQFDWVNVMAYDAGQQYATSLYQVALANYAKYLPKSKILLGLDIQTQWPGFNETAEQLAAKALWQKQNGYGGAMFWGVNVQNNPAQELQFITKISDSLNQ